MRYPRRPWTQGLFPKVCALLGAAVFAGVSVLVFAVPPKGVKRTESSPTVSLPPPKETYFPKERPSSKPSPTKTPRAKTTSTPTKAAPTASAKASSTPTRKLTSLPSAPAATPSSAPRPSTSQPSPKPTRSTPSTAPTSAVTTSTLRAQIIYLINQQRANAGLSTLSSSSFLSDQAHTWSAEMATRQALVHSGMDFGGELIASGYTAAQGVLNGWLNSPAHRQIIFTERYRFIGSGLVDNYWTVQFE